jgi:putative flippase GtrA
VVIEVGKIIRFGLVGGAGLLAYWLGATALATWLGVSPAVAHVVSYLACIGPMYLLQHAFVFKADTMHGYSAPRYLLTQMCNIVIGALLSPLLIQMGVQTLEAYLIVGVLNSATGFFIQLLWVFRRRAALAL